MGGRVWVSVGLVVSVGCLCGSLLLLVVGVFSFSFSFFSPSSFLLLVFPIFSKGLCL